MADISKIKVGNQVVNLKDADSRTKLATLLADHTAAALGTAAFVDTATSVTETGTALPTQAAVHTAIKNAIAALEGGVRFRGVITREEGETDLQAIARVITDPKAGDLVLMSDNTKEYIYDGEKWEELGDTAVYLKKTEAAATYVPLTRTIAGIDLNDDVTAAEVKTALDLKAMAHAAQAKGSTTLETIDSITMEEMTVAGDAAITHTSTAATLSKSDYTPSGSITVDGKAQTGEGGVQVIKGGSIAVTVKDAASKTEASLTYGAYTPAGSVSLTKDNNGAFQVSGTVSKPEVTVDDSAKDTFVKSLKAGTVDAASFSEGTFVPASIDAAKFFSAGSLPTKEADTFTAGSFTKGDAITAAEAGVVASIDADDAEMLVFTAAATNSVMSHGATWIAPTYSEGAFAQGSLPSINVEQGFSGGSKAPDTFNANKLPVVDGTASAVTAVTAALAAAPEFTGDKFAPAFAGTEVAQMKVTKAEYLKQEIDTASFTPVAATLGFSGTESKNILVTGVTYDKADATAAYSTTVTPETKTLAKTAKTIEIVSDPYNAPAQA